jgi:carbon monoxide dehydrogenase subunit G
MHLQHQFDVSLPAPAAWELINHIEEITPCLPGATAVRVDDDRYDVSMRVKLGPLDLQFKGTITITEKDADGRRMVVKSKLQEGRGQGSATGSTVVVLAPQDQQTRVLLETDFSIAGRVAQMGRGFVGDVSNDLLGQFSDNLARLLASRSASSAASESSSAGAAAESAPKFEPPRAQQLNVFGLLWRVLIQRLGALFGVTPVRK